MLCSIRAVAQKKMVAILVIGSKTNNENDGQPCVESRSKWQKWYLTAIHYQVYPKYKKGRIPWSAKIVWVESDVHWRRLTCVHHDRPMRNFQSTQHVDRWKGSCYSWTPWVVQCSVCAHSALFLYVIFSSGCDVDIEMCQRIFLSVASSPHPPC